MFSNKAHKFRPYLFLLPGLIIVACLVGYGLFSAIVESLSTPENEGDFYYYIELWQNNTFLQALGISIWVAAVSTVISILVGLYLTRTMVRLFRKDHWKFLAWLPMLIPHFVAAYLVFLLFSPSGWVSSMFYQLGWIGSIGEFPVMVNDPFYLGVIFTYIWKEIPFVILMLLPVYQEMDLRYEDVSRTLGGSKWTVFKTVEFPWVWPVSIEVFLILFVFILGAFEVPALLGVTYPKMLPVLAYDWFYQAAWVNRPLAQAMMVCLSIVSLFAAILILTFSRRWRKKWTVRREEI
ncbi:ABC transporter permease [Salipaludibacillus keqinensis]|uniref:ABC transporter permease n=1 Tax=Salipaludibacillus keqinensis TaxID=2045207 RepID=UPI001E2D6785|nr:ABC transporter permease subunit [Salipaludibacillus keqinensis]